MQVYLSTRIYHFCTLNSSKDLKSLIGQTAVFLVASLLSFFHSHLFIAAFAIVKFLLIMYVYVKKYISKIWSTL